MDLSHVLIYIILNLLPAKAKEAKAYAGEDRNAPVFVLACQPNKEWLYERKDSENEKRFIIFKRSSSDIQTRSEATGITYNEDINAFLDLKNINWKTVKQIQFKEASEMNFKVERGKNFVKLIKNSSETEGNALYIVWR